MNFTVAGKMANLVMPQLVQVVRAVMQNLQANPVVHNGKKEKFKNFKLLLSVTFNM
jgi:hypothetical protein